MALDGRKSLFSTRNEIVRVICEWRTEHDWWMAISMTIMMKEKPMDRWMLIRPARRRERAGATGRQARPAIEAKRTVDVSELQGG